MRSRKSLEEAIKLAIGAQDWGKFGDKINPINSKQALVELILINTFVLLDIRDLLQNPPEQIGQAEAAIAAGKLHHDELPEKDPLFDEAIGVARGKTGGNV